MHVHRIQNHPEKRHIRKTKAYLGQLERLMLGIDRYRKVSPPRGHS